MILNYAARNAVNPAVKPDHIAQFQKLALQQNPQLAAGMPHYQNVASQVAQRIEGLDPTRRTAAHADLNANLLRHVSGAMTSGKTQPAVAAIHQHMHNLAQQYGVGIPPGAPPPPQRTAGAGTATGGAVPPMASMLAREAAARGGGGPMGSASPAV